MSGKRSRDKGKRFEREVARRMIECGYADARRGIQARTGADACDVEGTDFWLECKHHAQVNLRKALRQAVRESETAGDERMPVAVCKDDGSEPVVILRWTDFQLLLLRAKGDA